MNAMTLLVKADIKIDNTEAEKSTPTSSATSVVRNLIRNLVLPTVSVQQFNTDNFAIRGIGTFTS